MRTFVMGDIHGQCKALLGCLEAVRFDYTADRLIALGDLCDRGNRVRECFEELLKISHCVYLLGNHDAWALAWAEWGKKEDLWLQQGGAKTIAAYGSEGMPPAHRDFLNQAPRWFQEGRRLFVHAGFDPRLPMEKQDKELLIWDRDLVSTAWHRHQTGKDLWIKGYEEIFIGHTPTINFENDRPLHLGNLWVLDTGAGYGRMLTIMDVETKEFWQQRAVD